MPPFHPVPAKKMVKILLRLGFYEIRIKGSHHFFSNPITKKTTVIPIHGNEPLGPGLLKEILRDIELNVDDCEKLRQKV